MTNFDCRTWRSPKDELRMAKESVIATSRSFLGRNGDGHELVCLVLKPVQFLQSPNVDWRLSKFGFRTSAWHSEIVIRSSKLENVPEHFEPETGFVRFLFNRAEFRDEVRL